MPCYIELNEENIVVAVHDLEQEYSGEATVINTGDRFLAEHFGDRYIGNMTEFTECWEILEKPSIIEPPPVDPMVQALDNIQMLETQVKQLKSELVKAKQENQLATEMSQAALGEILLAQAQSMDLMEGGV
ncbi:MAG: hypothetical protein UGE23_11185 [Peptococcaceae bacterium]|nr:hypothetical protein [Peptococcaceae bacterium]